MIKDTLPLQLASLLIFFGSLAIGYMLLRLRDIIFGQDVIMTKGDHRIDFNKKIVEEEQLNLDMLVKDRYIHSK